MYLSTQEESLLLSVTPSKNGKDVWANTSKKGIQKGNKFLKIHSNFLTLQETAK